MKRSGFARPRYESPSDPGRIVRMPDYSVQAHSGGGRAKEPRLECPHLLLMARRPRQKCLLAVKCNGAVERDDCCAAHGNGFAFNKGMGMKAHDFYTVRACPVCHTWLDSSCSASREERLRAFIDGHKRQVDEWRRAICAPSTVGKDWAAIDWALRAASAAGPLA